MNESKFKEKIATLFKQHGAELDKGLLQATFGADADMRQAPLYITNIKKAEYVNYLYFLTISEKSRFVVNYAFQIDQAGHETLKIKKVSKDCDKKFSKVIADMRDTTKHTICCIDEMLKK